MYATNGSLSLLFALPLVAVLAVGCGGDPNDNECTGADCEGSDTGDSSCEDCPDETTFEATIHMMAPDGYVGDFYVDNDLFHEDADECWWTATEDDKYLVELDLGPNYDALGKYVEITEDGQTAEVSWDEGEYGLMPCGDYEGELWNGELCVDWVGGVLILETSFGPDIVVTGNSFFLNEDGLLIEGTIADDLSSIEYYQNYNGDENEDTLYLR